MMPAQTYSEAEDLSFCFLSAIFNQRDLQECLPQPSKMVIFDPQATFDHQVIVRRVLIKTSD